MNYIKLLISILLLNGTVHSSLPGVEYVESNSGSGTQYSFVITLLPCHIVKASDNASPLTSEKEELIRVWIESTSIFKMSN